MKKIFFLCFVISSLLSSISCERNDSPKGGDGVTFTAISGDFVTKAVSTSAFTVGNQAVIYGYLAGAVDASADGQLPAVATAEDGGSGNTNLALVSPLFLPKETYDFYCLSKNTNAAAVTDFDITAGKSKTLEHNIDYLWAATKNQVIENNSNIPFVLKRLSSKITIRLTGNSAQGVSDLDVTDVKIKLPEIAANEGILDLGTGVVSPCATLAATHSTITEASANEWSYIILPCSALELDMTVMANFNIRSTIYNNRDFAATVAVVGGFLPGKHYTVQATVGAKEVTFNGVTVEDWKEEALPATDLF